MQCDQYNHNNNKKKGEQYITCITLPQFLSLWLLLLLFFQMSHYFIQSGSFSRNQNFLGRTIEKKGNYNSSGNQNILFDTVK